MCMKSVRATPRHRKKTAIWQRHVWIAFFFSFLIHLATFFHHGIHCNSIRIGIFHLDEFWSNQFAFHPKTSNRINMKNVLKTLFLFRTRSFRANRFAIQHSQHSSAENFCFVCSKIRILHTIASGERKTKLVAISFEHLCNFLASLGPPHKHTDTYSIHAHRRAAATNVWRTKERKLFVYREIIHSNGWYSWITIRSTEYLLAMLLVDLIVSERSTQKRNNIRIIYKQITRTTYCHHSLAFPRISHFCNNQSPYVHAKRLYVPRIREWYSTHYTHSSSCDHLA